jgi:hypothetical protein
MRGRDPILPGTPDRAFRCELGVVPTPSLGILEDVPRLVELQHARRGVGRLAHVGVIPLRELAVDERDDLDVGRRIDHQDLVVVPAGHGRDSTP